MRLASLFGREAAGLLGRSERNPYWLRMAVKSRVQRWAQPVARRLGFRLYFVPFKSYYWAIPDQESLHESLWRKPSELAGIDLHEERQLELLRSFGERFGEEIERLDLPYGAFGACDGQILYSMVRHFGARRVIEIGSGCSTRVTARALLKNREVTGQPTDFTAIEPYPHEFLTHGGIAGLDRLIRGKVQDVPLEAFGALGENDILFIDSSHVLHIGSDVQYEFLEILPRLRPGVVVHVHDVYLPYEYPEKWTRDGYFWSEQYLLQAFLSCNDAFEVVWSGYSLHRRHRDAFAAAFKCYDPANAFPSSFWIRRVK